MIAKIIKGADFGGVINYMFSKEKENPHMQRLEEQFLLVSRTMKAPADGPDCIEGGWWLLNENLMKLGEEAVIIGKRITNKKRY